MANYKLCYFIEGDECLDYVSISKGATIKELRNMIYEQLEPDFWNGIAAARLRLLKVDIDHTPHLGAIQDLRAGHNVQMDVTRRVDEIWPDQPNELHLHVCVKFPTVILQKRSVPQQGDVHSQFKRTKNFSGILVRGFWMTAQNQTIKSRQSLSYTRVLDTSQDIMDGRDDVPGLADIEVAKLQMAVDAFATEMTRFFENESQRRDKGLELLRGIFAARRGTPIPRMFASAIGSVVSDGHNVAVGGTSSIVVEFKNSPTDISAVPQVQVAGYVAHLNAALAKGAFLQWRVPCLGLTIVGEFDPFIFQGYLTIGYVKVVISRSMLSWQVDHQIRLVSLTPTLSCVRSASDGRDRKSLYLAFAAASVLQAQILEDAQKLTRKRLEDPTFAEIPARNRRYPAISQLSVSKYATSCGPDDYLSFEICGLLDDRVYDRFLYKAKRPGVDEFFLIKFAQRYSIDLHHFCAKAGHAPSILGYERLPGGWFAVAMEELVNLVESFHAENLVHGDLRDANIICRGDSMMLIDFDWGGKVGEASYPTLALNPELLDGRVTDDLMISISDDARSHSDLVAKLALQPLYCCVTQRSLALPQFRWGRIRKPGVWRIDTLVALAKLTTLGSLLLVDSLALSPSPHVLLTIVSVTGLSYERAAKTTCNGPGFQRHLSPVSTPTLTMQPNSEHPDTSVKTKQRSSDNNAWRG
ncbi:hypothetical protein H4582DRAFT_2076825 [Lactarius indigo]|nr:hypothetical protein H4582DRAFT_2076825 [Lactarius indigo]